MLNGFNRSTNVISPTYPMVTLIRKEIYCCSGALGFLATAHFEPLLHHRCVDS